jgi:choline kinase
MTLDKAVIVAAGLSSRLYPLTAETPKALLPVGEESMLARSIRILRECGISQVAVVVGFRADSIRKAVDTDTAVIANPFYRHCNNMGSLFTARDFVGDDPAVYLHGDLAYSEAMLSAFLEATRTPGDSILDLLTDFAHVDEEAMKVRVDSANRLIESNKGIPLDEAAGEWTGIAVIHRPHVVFDEIESHLMSGGLTDYDTAAFTTLAARHEVRCIPATDDPWKEIDTLDDLEAARAAFGDSR